MKAALYGMEEGKGEGYKKELVYSVTEVGHAGRQANVR